MQTIYRLPQTLQEDLDKLLEETRRFKSGESSSPEYRSFRVPQGVYEQRDEGTFMLRVRLPAGAILPHQMRAAAAVARKYGSGLVHITTRQDIQIHAVPLDGIHPALVDLYTTAGLSTKGGGGNTMRNITACPDAGVCPKECFDVAPYAVAVTEFMLCDPLSFQLPRKYKISFAGCADDCVGVVVNDLGFIARKDANGEGFAVYVGGGMGPHPRMGRLLEEFVPAGEAYLVAEAVKRVFDKHGNRKNKQRARLRYLLEEQGLERFKELYKGELSRLRVESPPVPSVRGLPGHNGRDSAGSAAASPGEGFEAWRSSNVVAQKQEGFYVVHGPVFLGELSADTFERLAGVVEQYGEGMTRTTPSQNLVIRWVTERELPGLHRELAALDLAACLPPVLHDLIVCTGANTCKLGICLPQGLAGAISDKLNSGPDGMGLELEDAADLRLYMNGCPNSCGRHPIGSIALVGAARRVNDRLVPHYMLQLGGRVGEGRTRLAQGKELIPARNVPDFLAEYLAAFRESTHYPDFDAFLDADGREQAARITAKHQNVPPFAEDRNYYYDWGAEELFSLAGRSPGECSAGVFDLIRVDLASAHDALKMDKPLSATALAARSMLITRGEETKDAADSLRLFEKHFVETGLVDVSCGKLIAKARQAFAAGGADKDFDVPMESVTTLVAAVEGLYENMDQSLRFHVQPTESADPKPGQDADIQIDREADFHGVTCPLNYVKTKMLLAQMDQGQVLSVLLDEAGGRSVPESAGKDGHTVLSKQKHGDRWQVLIRKG